MQFTEVTKDILRAQLQRRRAARMIPFRRTVGIDLNIGCIGTQCFDQGFGICLDVKDINIATRTRPAALGGGTCTQTGSDQTLITGLIAKEFRTNFEQGKVGEPARLIPASGRDHVDQGIRAHDIQIGTDRVCQIQPFFELAKKLGPARIRKGPGHGFIKTTRCQYTTGQTNTLLHR